MSYCLGLEILGECTNYTNFEMSVFDIGIFLTVIGVLFAGFQLIKPIQKFRYRIRYNKFVLFLYIIPFITIILSTILPFIPGEALPILGYPIFWQIFTALYIIIIGLIIIFLLITRKINNYDDKKGKINKLFLSSLASNKDIDCLVNELGYFFKDFLDKYINEENKKEWGYAREFMKILQNQRLIDNLINNPSTIQIIIKTYKSDKRDFISYYEKDFISKIIYGSFCDNNSFLSLELEDNFNLRPGNRNGIILYELINDLNLLEKTNLINTSSFYLYLSNNIFAENLLKFSCKIIEEFLNIEKIYINFSKHRLLYYTFKLQSKVIEKCFKQLGHNSLWRLIPYNFSYSISLLSPKIIEIYSKLGKDIPTFNFEKDFFIGVDESKIYNIIDAFAFGLYELLEAFAHYRNENIRDYTLELTQNIHDSILANEIEKRILILMKNKIKINLKGWYPMVSMVFLENYSYQIFYGDDKVKINKHILEIFKLYAKGLPKLLDGYIYSYTEDTLKNKYRKEKAIEKAKEILEHLLPKNIIYDNDTKTLTSYTNGKLGFSQINLEEFLKTGELKVLKN